MNEALACFPMTPKSIDNFATFTNTSSIDIFLRNVSSVHNHILFSKEVKLHNFLAFLDVLIIEKTD